MALVGSPAGKESLAANFDEARRHLLDHLRDVTQPGLDGLDVGNGRVLQREERLRVHFGHFGVKAGFFEI